MSQGFPNGNGPLKASHAKFPHREGRTRLQSRSGGRAKTWTGQSSRVANGSQPKHFINQDFDYSLSTAPAGIRMADGRVEAMPPPLPDGAMGGRFSSTTSFRPVSHAAMRNQYSRRGTRLQPIYSQRYVAIPPEEDAAMLGTGQQMSGVAMTVLDKSRANTSRFLGPAAAASIGVPPPRNGQPSMNVLLVGNQMTPRNRHNMEQEELLQFARLGLAPAPELYFGRGFGTEAKSIRLRQLQHKPSDRPGTSSLETLPPVDTSLAVTATNIEAIDSSDPIAEEPAAEVSEDEAPPTSPAAEPEPEPTPAEEKAVENEGATSEPEPEPDMGGWAGTVLDEAAKPTEDVPLDNKLLKNVDAQPVELDLYTYQLREIFGAADDETLAALNAVFMGLDEAGAGSISSEQLDAGVTSQFGAEGSRIVRTLLSIPATNAVSIREYIVCALVASKVTLPETLERYTGLGDAFNPETCESLRDMFYQRDANKTGKLDLAALREMLKPGYPEIADDNARWEDYIAGLDIDEHGVSLEEFIVKIAELIA